MGVAAWVLLVLFEKEDPLQQFPGLVCHTRLGCCHRSGTIKMDTYVGNMTCLMLSATSTAHASPSAAIQRESWSGLSWSLGSITATSYYQATIFSTGRTRSTNPECLSQDSKVCTSVNTTLTTLRLVRQTLAYMQTKFDTLPPFGIFVSARTQRPGCISRTISSGGPSLLSMQTWDVQAPYKTTTPISIARPMQNNATEGSDNSCQTQIANDAWLLDD